MSESVSDSVQGRFKTNRLRCQQILAAQWRNDSNLTYTIVGLGEDGFVYEFSQANGWEALEDRIGRYKKHEDDGTVGG